jgi:hypothetical protein
MATQELMKNLCFDDRGGLRTKPECRAAIINHLILEESVDIDEAEDLADKTLRDLNMWPEPEKTIDLPDEEDAGDPTKAPIV